MMKKVAIALVVMSGLLTSSTVLAGETSKLVKTRSKAAADVTLGKWHAGFSKCKSYAEKNGVPLIAVWSNGDACSHCVRFESACNSTNFKNWMATSGCVFYFIYSGDGGDGKIESKVFHWIRGDNTSYPFIRVYWPKGKVNVYSVGDVIDGNENGATGGKNAVNYFKNVLKKYKPAPIVPTYSGGSFAVASGVLQAETNATKYVDVTIVRSGASVIATEYVNKLVVTYPDGVAETNDLKWAKGVDELTYRVQLEGKCDEQTVGEKIELKLLDSSSKPLAATAKAVDATDISFVEEPENSPKNPRWIGERTSETLAFGEWTMDIDVATNKADRAHTLLLIGGPLWCPDCQNAEEKLFATEDFHQWAVDNKVACVAIDEPPFAAGISAPTLLSNEKGPEWAPVSGADYISRKMIPLEGNDTTNAAFIAKRNLDYVMNDTAHGGYCTPDNLDGSGNAGVWGTGVPCVIALRKDGSVAGRLYQFSNDFRSEGVTNTPVSVLLKRLDELLAQEDVPNEDLNDSRRTTSEIIGQRETVEGNTLSFIDGADVYRLNPAETYGKRINFTLDAESDVWLAMDIITVSGNKEKVIASVINDTCPIDIAANINSTNAYVKVYYPADENGYSIYPQFALTNSESTVFAYSLTTDFVVEPKEEGETVELSDDRQMSVALVSNEVYRITNFEGLKGILEPTEGTTNCLFMALVTDDVQLEISGTSAEVQLWHPGDVGFAVEKAMALESLGSYVIRLIRQNGVSGVATVNLSRNPELSSPYEDLIELPPEFYEPFVWENGDDKEKTVTVLIANNKFADGNQLECFDASVGGSAAEGIKRLMLTIRDDDQKSPGYIAFAGAAPSLAKGTTGYARAGETMVVDLAREGGADGEQAVTLATTDGTLDQTEFAWESRTMGKKTVQLTLPSSGKSVKLMMTPAKGSFVDASRRILTINLLDANVPGFSESTISSVLSRYVAFEPIAIAVDPSYVTDWAKVKISKFSGALPSGLSWAIAGTENKQLVISGVPTKAGSFTSVFRVSEGSVAGLTVAVEITVADPAVTGGGDAGLDPLNASVKTSRTFSNVPVWDTEAKALAGQLTLTVPRTGKLSAKYVTVDAMKPATFSCASWNELSADGTLTAQLTGSVGTNAATLDVSVAATGAVTAQLSYAARENLTVDIPENIWSKKNPATDFKGYYTVQLPVATVESGNMLARGCGYMTLKMTAAADINAGKFAYAGVLPNGNSFSGSATLCAKDWLEGEGFNYWSRGVLPILIVTSADTIAGAVNVNPGAADPEAKDYDGEMSTGRCYYKWIRRVISSADETVPSFGVGGILWSHSEKRDEIAYAATLDAWGTYYDATEDFLTQCKNNIGSGSLKLFALSGMNDLPEELIGSEEDDGALAKGAWVEKPTNIVAGVTVSFAKATSKAKTKTSAIKTADSKKLALTFTLSSGILSGTFKLPMESGSVTFNYRGVVLPGFGYGQCAACGFENRIGGIESTMRPFAAGTAWVNDTFSYDDDKGKTRKLTVRRSTPFSVGGQPGE